MLTRKEKRTTTIKAGDQEFEIDEDLLNEYREAFRVFDVDENGEIDATEMKDALISLGFEAKTKTIHDIINEIDVDKSGKIDFGEFVKTLLDGFDNLLDRKNIEKAFDLLDEEKQGKISIKNLRRVVKDLGIIIDDNELQEMIERTDSDNDGYVTCEDFYNIITSKASGDVQRERIEE